MTNKSEKSQLIQTLKSMGVPYKIYTSRLFIHEVALSFGAKSTVCVRDSLDFAFNSKGKLIGTFTLNVGSFLFRKKVV